MNAEVIQEGTPRRLASPDTYAEAARKYHDLTIKALHDTRKARDEAWQCVWYCVALLAMTMAIVILGIIV